MVFVRSTSMNTHSAWTGVFAGDVEVDHVFSDEAVGDAVAVIGHLSTTTRSALATS